MNGKVERVLICKEAGEDLYEIEKASLVPGKGIEGDRYYFKAGTFSDALAEKGDFEVTLIEQEEIEGFNVKAGLNYIPEMFRRNIVTSGVSLNELVGKQFYIGSAKLEGIRLCEPCAYLEKLLGKEVMSLMVHKAGLRAVIKNGGIVVAGNGISKC